MLDIKGRIPAAPTPPKMIAVEYYTVGLAPLADGKIFVSLTATTVDDEEPQLLNQEIASDSVATIDEALAIIKAHVRIASEPPCAMPAELD